MLKFNTNFNYLPNNVKQYIVEAIDILGKDNIYSLIHFGSQKFTDVSDVDLLFVISGIEHNEIKKRKIIIRNLEIKYGFRSIRKSLSGNILNIFENETGMFCSNFICTSTDLINGNYSSIFNTNKFLTYLFVPTNIIFSNVFLNCKIIYGEDITSLLPIFNINRLQLFKSTLMCSILSIISIFLLLFSNEATKYAMEAVKWSLHNSYYYYTKKTMTTEQLISFFIGCGLNDISKLQQLRLKYQKSIAFNLLSLPLVLKLHINGSKILLNI